LEDFAVDSSESDDENDKHRVRFQADKKRKGGSSAAKSEKDSVLDPEASSG